MLMKLSLSFVRNEIYYLGIKTGAACWNTFCKKCLAAKPTLLAAFRNFLCATPRRCNGVRGQFSVQESVIRSVRSGEAGSHRVEGCGKTFSEIWRRFFWLVRVEWCVYVCAG